MTLVIAICLCLWVPLMYNVDSHAHCFDKSLQLNGSLLKVVIKSRSSCGVIVASEMSLCQESEESEGQPEDRKQQNNFHRAQFTKRPSSLKRKSEDVSEWWITISAGVFFAADTSRLCLSSGTNERDKDSAGDLTIYQLGNRAWLWYFFYVCIYYNILYVSVYLII